MMRKTLVLVFISLAVFFSVHAGAEESVSLDEMKFGVPFGGSEDIVGVDLCPQGARVISMFLAAWQQDDYKVMYDLLDDKSKKDYPYEEAKFDFQFMEFKEYRISSVRKRGDNFEFLLNYGDWKSGTKEVKKMLIDGESFKIIMLTRNSPFQNSADSYF